MNISGNGKRLAQLTLQLSNQWQQTREHWQDAKGLEFEAHYIEELRAGVERAVTVIEQLDKIVMKIRKDCE
jgi:hypothetical protein